MNEALSGIDGMSKFIDPLDLVEDTATGNLYVSEWGGQKLTLLRPRKDVSSKHVFVGPGIRAAAAVQQPPTAAIR